MPAEKHKPEEIIGKLREVEIMLGQGGIPATSPGNGDTAIAGLRFRFAPPPTGNGGGDDNELTIEPDHPVGAAHFMPGMSGAQLGRIDIHRSQIMAAARWTKPVK